MDTSNLVKKMYRMDVNEGEFFNRELSILNFNERVLRLAMVPNQSAKYIDIVFRNLVDFIRVRLPRCENELKGHCLRYIQELFDEMARIERLYKLSSIYSEAYDRFRYERIGFSYRPYELDWQPLRCVSLFTMEISRPGIDLYSYLGENPDENLDQLLYMARTEEESTDKRMADTIIAIRPNEGEGADRCVIDTIFTVQMDAPQYSRFKNAPVLYLEESVARLLVEIKTKKKLADDAIKPYLYLANSTFIWNEQFCDRFHFQKDNPIHQVVSTPPIPGYSTGKRYANTVVGAIEYLCTLPSVYLVCMTLYRTAKNSRIVDALVKASMMGKRVMVYVEIRARENELDNIHTVKRLKDAGVLVYHSFGGMKVHAKVFGAFSHDHQIAIFSTGNFNEDSANQYTDYHYITERGDYAQAVFDLFFRGFSANDPSYLVGKPPFGSHFIREEILQRINREKEKGVDGKIYIKCNSLTDRAIIRALYLAHEAGADVRLLIRTCIGIGDTGTLPVRSKVGEYLEHGRLYIFGEEVFISSADLMIRNLDRRVESFVEVKNSTLNPTMTADLTRCFELDWKSDNASAIHWDRALQTEILSGE